MGPAKTRQASGTFAAVALTREGLLCRRGPGHQGQNGERGDGDSATHVMSLSQQARLRPDPGYPLDSGGPQFYKSRTVVDRKEVLLICKALSDPTRLRILELLKSKGRSCCDLIARDEKGLCACDVEEAVGLSKAAVSHHMALLRRAGLVNAEKRGRWIYYSRNEAAIAGLADALAKAV